MYLSSRWPSIYCECRKPCREMTMRADAAKHLPECRVSHRHTKHTRWSIDATCLYCSGRAWLCKPVCAGRDRAQTFIANSRHAYLLSSKRQFICHQDSSVNNQESRNCPKHYYTVYNPSGLVYDPPELKLSTSKVSKCSCCGKCANYCHYSVKGPCKC